MEQIIQLLKELEGNKYNVLTSNIQYISTCQIATMIDHFLFFKSENAIFSSKYIVVLN